MRWIAGVVLLANVALLAGPDQQATFKSGVDLVAVDVSIVDRNGRPVDDLKLDEFTLKVDGKTRKLSSAEFINLRRVNNLAFNDGRRVHQNVWADLAMQLSALGYKARTGPHLAEKWRNIKKEYFVRSC